MGAIMLPMLAIPAKPGLRTLRQADGTTLSVRLIGDERFHTMVTTDGLAVARQSDGSVTYLDPATMRPSAVLAHNPGARTEAEAEFLQLNASQISATAVAKKSQARRAAKAAPAQAPRKVGSTQVPNTGKARVPVILVEYSDYKFKDKDPNATFCSFFKEGNKSVYQYFVDQSNGKYTPQFDVYGPFTLPNKRAYYGGNDSYGNDLRVCTMVAQGCQGLDKQINFRDYDNDGDGECDVVVVLYAGDGEASSYEEDCEDSVWPCQWQLSDPYGDYGKALTLDGVTVDRFGVFNELNGSDLTKIDGIGTVCHEFSHCLGLPDFYETTYANGYFGMGPWSLMDTGPYNDDGYTPIGYSAYEKEFMGWITIPEAQANTHYSLTPLNLKDEATDQAVRVTNDRDKDEYYILENRKQQGWDAFMPAEGLMISHVTYKQDYWDQNVVNTKYTPNTTGMQCMTLMPADGLLKVNKENYYGETYYQTDEASLQGDLWPYAGNNELTDTSNPAATVNTGSRMGKPITAIKKEANGEVSFWFMKTALPALNTPAGLTLSNATATGFTASWTHEAEGADVEYLLEVKKHADCALVMENNFGTATNQWTNSSSGLTAKDDYLQIGSSKNIGTVTSPEFTLDASGIVTVICNAAMYNSSEAASVVVNLLDAAGNKKSTASVELTTSSEATIALKLTGTANSKMKVQFTAAAKKSRYLLYNAKVYTGDATSLVQTAAKAPSETGGTTSRTISGITELSYTVSGLETGKYDVRVKAVPTTAQAEINSESPWTTIETIDLSSSGIESVIAAEDADAEAEYYTLHGIKANAAALTPGIYIVRRGSKVTKETVK